MMIVCESMRCGVYDVCIYIEWVLLIRYWWVYVEMFDNQSAISPFFFMTRMRSLAIVYTQPEPP